MIWRHRNKQRGLDIGLCLHDFRHVAFQRLAIAWKAMLEIMPGLRERETTFCAAAYISPSIRAGFG